MAFPSSTVDGEGVQWLSVDPRCGEAVPYENSDSALLESSYARGVTKVDLRLGGGKFTVVFAEMLQYNSSGGSRRVVRLTPLVFATPERLSVAVGHRVLAIADAVDRQIALLEGAEGLRNHTVMIPPDDAALIVRVFDCIAAHFTARRFRERFGFVLGRDNDAISLRVNSPVPAYFANVSQGESIFRRKMLAIAGLRNLAVHGPTIYAELGRALFSANPSDYEPGTGPHRMKALTGNAVDLDDVVLRCSDPTVLRAINAQQTKHGRRPFKDAAALARSDVAKEMVWHQAGTRISDFVVRFRLTEEEINRRSLRIPTLPLGAAEATDAASLPPIHCATDNSDRGRAPVWQYSNVGVLAFHVNVPNMDDVRGALLRAPFHLAKAFVLAHHHLQPTPATKAARVEPGATEYLPDAREEVIDAFFDEAVADSCFNAKWKAIELYLATLQNAGSIDDVLATIERDRQAEFAAVMANDDQARSKEQALLWSVVKSRCAMGRDVAAGNVVRVITESDVASWIARTGAV